MTRNEQTYLIWHELSKSRQISYCTDLTKYLSQSGVWLLRLKSCSCSTCTIWKLGLFSLKCGWTLWTRRLARLFSLSEIMMSTFWEAFQTKKMPDSAYVQILEYFSLTMTFCGGNKGWLKPGFRPALHCIALPPGVTNTSPPRRMRVIAKQLHRIRETAMHNVIYTRWQCLDRPHFLIPFWTLILSPSLYFAPTPYFWSISEMYTPCKKNYYIPLQSL